MLVKTNYSCKSILKNNYFARYKYNKKIKKIITAKLF